MKLPEEVTISDLTLRDGFQNEPRFIPTEAKLLLAGALIDAGFRELEVTAFAPPRFQPQFRDWEDILKGLPDRSDIVYSCVTTNPRATGRAFDARQNGYRVDRVVLGILPASEQMNRIISGMDYAQTWEWIDATVKRAHEVGMKVNAFISGIFSPSIPGEAPPMEKAWDFAERLLEMGVDDVEHPDHEGEAMPDEVYEYFVRVLRQHPDPQKHVFHVHDARGAGLACYFAALQAGVRRFETCLGGLGGAPAPFVDGIPVGGLKFIEEKPRYPGLVSTEDFVVMLDGMGIDAHVDVDKVLALGVWAEKICQRRLRSFSIGLGTVPK